KAARLGSRSWSSRQRGKQMVRRSKTRAVDLKGVAAIATVLVCSAALFGVSPSARASASTGTVALWHMDETSGTVMYDSVGTHNGTLHSIQLGLPGFSGKSYGFNGTSSSVTVPSAPDLNPGSAIHSG